MAESKDISRYEYDLKKGLNFQRELFKKAKLQNDYKVMVTAIYNLKADLKSKAKKNDMEEEIKKVEKAIKWYNNEKYKHLKRTQDGGMAWKPPARWPQKVDDVLTSAYEKLMEIQENLGLI